MYRAARLVALLTSSGLSVAAATERAPVSWSAQSVANRAARARSAKVLEQKLSALPGLPPSLVGKVRQVLETGEARLDEISATLTAGSGLPNFWEKTEHNDAEHATWVESKQGFSPPAARVQATPRSASYDSPGNSAHVALRTSGTEVSYLKNAPVPMKQESYFKPTHFRNRKLSAVAQGTRLDSGYLVPAGAWLVRSRSGYGREKAYLVAEGKVVRLTVDDVARIRPPRAPAEDFQWIGSSAGSPAGR
jgi:hypothetical protein